VRAAKQHLGYLKQQRDLLEKSIARQKKQLLQAVERQNDLARQVGEYFRADVVLSLLPKRGDSHLESRSTGASGNAGNASSGNAGNAGSGNAGAAGRRGTYDKQLRAKLKEVLLDTPWYGTCLLPRRRALSLWAETAIFPDGLRLRVKRFMPGRQVLFAGLST
jgi:hypothetical protein